MRFCSPGTKLIEHYACRGTNLNAIHIFIHGYKFNVLHWRGPGLSPVTKLSLVFEQNAKTMTSLLIIPSVLACVFYYCLVPIPIKNEFQSQ
jgi:hypothetical protein